MRMCARVAKEAHDGEFDPPNFADKLPTCPDKIPSEIPANSEVVLELVNCFRTLAPHAEIPNI